MIRLQEYFFFGSRLIRSIYNGEVYPQVLFLSDEAWLSLCGEVKSQSCGCWSTENQELFTNPLFMTKKLVVGVR